MTNYPITDPAEIAKLPPGYYLFTCPKWMNGYEGTDVLKKCDDGDLYWANDDGDNWFEPSELAEAGGGIQCELVPATERDELARLLRRGVDLLEQDHGCDDSGVEKFGRGYCDLHDFAADARAALAKLEQASDDSCERCGGEKTVAITPEQFEQGGNGWERPCPDCTEAGA